MKPGAFILDIQAASFGYKSRRSESVLLKQTSLQLRKNELVGLVGRNGSGKSTLLRTIMKLNPLLEGKIFINGQDLDRFQPAEMARTCGFVPTGLVNAGEMKVKELVELGRYPYTNWYGKMTIDDNIAVEEALGAVSLADLEDRLVSEISDGEKQRAMIARTLAQQTSLILLDEPSAFLDIPNKYEIATLLRQLCNHDHAAVFSTHDLNLALQYADKIWLIEDDRVIQGAPEDLIIDGKIERLFNSGKVIFDRSGADFTPKVNYRGVISVEAENVPGYVYTWTVKALGRKGFQITTDSYREGNHLIIRHENDQNIWNLQQDNKNLLFNTLYDLTLHLNLDNHELN